MGVDISFLYTKVFPEDLDSRQRKAQEIVCRETRKIFFLRMMVLLHRVRDFIATQTGCHKRKLKALSE
jgi:hypothetical protein